MDPRLIVSAEMESTSTVRRRRVSRSILAIIILATSHRDRYLSLSLFLWIDRSYRRAISPVDMIDIAVSWIKSVEISGRNRSARARRLSFVSTREGKRRFVKESRA